MQCLDQDLLHIVMEIAQRMTQVGGEISRVEESVSRMFSAYGAARVDVYATTSNIIVSVEDAQGVVLTQTRRIGRISLDMEGLHRYNDLARWVAAGAPSLEEIREHIRKAQFEPRYPIWMNIVFSAVIAASFCVFFGGRSVAETAVAFGVGCLSGAVSVLLEKGKISPIMIRFVCALVSSVIAVAALKLNWIGQPDYVLIGNIMTLIPGIGITNALRDLFSGDVMTGILRSIEAVLLTLAIALGIILPMLAGGAL